MIHEVIIPKLGLTMEWGKIVRWLKQEGDQVTAGDVLFEVESDKSILEVSSQIDGYLRQILVSTDAETPVLEVVGLITDEADEEITGWETERAKSPSTAEKMVLKSQPGEPSSQASPAERTQQIIASPKARRIAKEKQIDLSLITGTGAAGRIEERDILDFQKRQPKLTPLARKMAVEAGIEPGKVNSQGNAGRITKADLEKMLQSESMSSVPASPTRESVITVRTIIAERMVHSHLTTAPVTLSTEADASSLVNLRTELNSAIRPDFDIPLSYNDFLVMITARALKEFPAMNTQWKDDRIIQLQEVNIGLAVETEHGLRYLSSVKPIKRGCSPSPGNAMI